MTSYSFSNYKNNGIFYQIHADVCVQFQRKIVDKKLEK